MDAGRNFALQIAAYRNLPTPLSNGTIVDVPYGHSTKSYGQQADDASYHKHNR